MPRIICSANHYINAVFEYGTHLFGELQPSRDGMEFSWTCGPPIAMKIGAHGGVCFSGAVNFSSPFRTVAHCRLKTGSSTMKSCATVATQSVADYQGPFLHPSLRQILAAESLRQLLGEIFTRFSLEHTPLQGKRLFNLMDKVQQALDI